MLRRNTALLAFCALAALGSTGCTTAPSLALERARTAVGAAKADPTVARHAPVELQRATDALALANGTWRRTHDEAETNHLAYMAVLQAEAARRAARTQLPAQGVRPVDPGVDHISLGTGTQAPPARR